MQFKQKAAKAAAAAAAAPQPTAASGSERDTASLAQAEIFRKVCRALLSQSESVWSALGARRRDHMITYLLYTHPRLFLLQKLMAVKAASDKEIQQLRARIAQLESAASRHGGPTPYARKPKPGRA